ncbi:hypothetical protein ABBQ32_008988 [Trebouxia sp. C0010 RCD-2024]
MTTSGQLHSTSVCAPARPYPASIHSPACHSQAKALGHSYRSSRSSVSSSKQATHTVSCSATQDSSDGHPSVRDRFMSALMACAAAASVTLAFPASSAFAEPQPFLSSTGGKGPLAEEEERLFKLRQEKEELVQKEITKQRQMFEREAREGQLDKLCATPFGVDVVGITEFIALTGALVGGFSARQRKIELERLNEQLRKINLNLRQQARAGTVYAPGLMYAPTPMPGISIGSEDDGVNPGGAATLVGPRPEAPEDSQGEMDTMPTVDSAMSYSPATSSVMASMDEDDMTLEAKQCLQALKEGKRLLKQDNGASALVRFEKAHMLARYTGDQVQQRRAVRGLAAAARLQGQYKAAVHHLENVLKLSSQMQDNVGDADAYGTIADIYTDMGDFDKAAEYYDKYISQMDTDGPV